MPQLRQVIHRGASPMNSQALANRLAELAGWRWDKNEKIWKHDRLGNAFYHGIEVGSLDASNAGGGSGCRRPVGFALCGP